MGLQKSLQAHVPYEVPEKKAKITVVPLGQTQFPITPIAREAKIILATTGSHKAFDWDRVARKHSVDFRLANAFWPYEESHEEELTAAQIAEGKLDLTIRDKYQALPESEKSLIFKKLRSAGGADILEMADDRFLSVDPRYKYAKAFEICRKNELVERDCYANAEQDFPNHRIKEVMDALGGPVEFLKALREAEKELGLTGQENLEYLSIQKTSGVALAVRALDVGVLPELADGFVVSVEQGGGVLQIPSDNDLEQLERAGKLTNITLDYFDKTDDRDALMDQLRLDLKDPYFDEDYCIGLAWQACAEILGLPELEQSRSLDYDVTIRAPIVATTMTLPPETRRSLVKTKATSQSPVGSIRCDVDLTRFDNLSDLEQKLCRADALVIGGSKNDARLSDEKKLLEKWRALLVFSYAATLKSLGDPLVDAMPIVVLNGMDSIIRPVATALQNAKAIGRKPEETYDAIEIFNRRAAQRLMIADRRYFTPRAQRTERKPILSAEQDLARDFSLNFDAYRLGMVGSASLGLPHGLQHGEQISYQAFKDGKYIVSGGGTKPGTMMGVMPSGCVKAFRQGATQGKYLGIRTPIASTREGILRPWVESTGFAVSKGGIDDDLVMLGDQFGFLNDPTFAGRQNSIAGLSDSLAVLPGGWGTVMEFAANGYDNVLQNMHGRVSSLLPRFERQARPMFFVNSTYGADNEGRYYSFLHDIFTPEEMDISGISVHDTAQSVLEAVDAHTPERLLRPQSRQPEMA